MKLPFSPYLYSEMISPTERITQTMYTESQMRQAIKDALEWAAQHCERVIDELQVTDDISEKLYLDGVDCAEEIRKLKDDV